MTVLVSMVKEMIARGKSFYRRIVFILQRITPMTRTILLMAPMYRTGVANLALLGSMAIES